MAGKIILLNGPSSAGKSTIARQLQDTLEEPFWHYSIDHFRDAGILPTRRFRNGDFSWQDMRPAFFNGFHHSIQSFAQCGNNMIVEHIIESQAWMDMLVRLLSSHDVFFVGLHCPIEELERRETARGDRAIGDARRDVETGYVPELCDLKLDGTVPPDQNVESLLAAWRARRSPSAFEQMLQRLDR